MKDGSKQIPSSEVEKFFIEHVFSYMTSETMIEIGVFIGLKPAPKCRFKNMFMDNVTVYRDLSGSNASLNEVKTNSIKCSFSQISDNIVKRWRVRRIGTYSDRCAIMFYFDNDGTIYKSDPADKSFDIVMDPFNLPMKMMSNFKNYFRNPDFWKPLQDK